MVGRLSIQHHYQWNNSHITIEDITILDYTHSKKVCKDFEIKKFDEYHGLYV